MLSIDKGIQERDEVIKVLVEALKNLINCFPSGTSFETVRKAEQALAKANPGEEK